MQLIGIFIYLKSILIDFAIGFGFICNVVNTADDAEENNLP